MCDCDNYINCDNYSDCVNHLANKNYYYIKRCGKYTYKK